MPQPKPNNEDEMFVGDESPVHVAKAAKKQQVNKISISQQIVSPRKR